MFFYFSMNRLINLSGVYILIILYSVHLTEQYTSIAYNIPDPDCSGVFNLCTDTDKERLGRQAIQFIHDQMDDDKDGVIEHSESADFINEELESNTDAVRHKDFQSANAKISFDDLWTQWKNNPVHNWTTDNVVDWLVNFVHLPQYVENFRRNQIDGRMIPRLAANEKQYLSSIMHIRNVRDKRRLMIKSADAVLFGPPQKTHHLLKDMILLSALFLSIGGCVYALFRQRQTQENMKIMLQELEILQQAEGNLLAVTERMKIRDSDAKGTKVEINQTLLDRWLNEVQRNKEEADRFRQRRNSSIDHEKQLNLALQEIEQLQNALRRAEEHSQQQIFEVPTELIDLLRRTQQIEEETFEMKRKVAETTLVNAKEQIFFEKMSKISKMQKGFFGAVRIAHSNCIDNAAELINAAKQRLMEIHEEYEERDLRWTRIGVLLNREDLFPNFNINSSLSMSNATIFRGRESPRLRS